MVRRYSVIGIPCSVLEVQKLAWFLERSMVVSGGRRLRAEVTEDPASSERSTSFTLTEDEVEELDDAFDRYRSGPGGGCTSYEMVYAVWRIRGQSPVVEYLYDASCSAWDGGASVASLLQERLDGVTPGASRRRRGWLRIVANLF